MHKDTILWQVLMNMENLLMIFRELISKILKHPRPTTKLQQT